MLALALSISLASSPLSTTVVVTRRTAVPAADGHALANEVAQALTAQGVTVAPSPSEAVRRLANLDVKDSSACLGRKPCIVEFGVQLEVGLLVSVSVSEFEGERSVALEAYRIPGGEVISRSSFFYARTARPSPQDLTDFALKTRAALGPPGAVATPNPSDAPKLTELTPAAESHPEVAQPPSSSRGHGKAYLVGGFAAASLVAAGVLGLTGYLTANQLKNTAAPGKSVFTYPQAQAQAARANTQLTASGICALVGAGLGVTAVVLW